MKKTTLASIRSHPAVKKCMRHKKDFIAVHWLPHSLNPYREEGIALGAATAWNGIPHIKMVAAFGMLLQDFRKGLYKNVARLIVPSSGNTAHGIGVLAQAFGIPQVVVVMPADTPQAKREAVRRIPGVRLILPAAGGSVQAVALAEAAVPGSLLVDQYKHVGNMLIHQTWTGPALLHALGRQKKRLRLVAIAMGSGGTATGVALHLKSVVPDVIIVGVRPKPGERVDGVRDVHRMDEVVTIPYEFALDAIVEVGRAESFHRADELNTRERLGVGPSSGLALAGLLQYLAGLSPEERERFRGGCAAFLCPDKDLLYGRGSISA